MQKCFYCDFYSLPQKIEYAEKYIECLKMEIESFNESAQVSTIYIGGGTPSVISEEYIAQVLQCIRSKFYVSENAEITIEVNPGTVTEEKLEKYIKARNKQVKHWASVYK